MNYFSSYLLLNIKRNLKKYTAVFVTTLILIAVLFLVAQMLFNINKNDISQQKIRIGIVGDISETYLGIGFSMLNNMQDLNMSMEFIEMQENEARKALESLDISAYLHVPDNYVRDMVRGRDVKLDFYMLKTSASAPSILISEVVRMVSPLVSESESAIYAMRDYARSVKADNISKLTRSLNIRYIDTVLGRTDSLDVKNIGIGSLSMAEYYISGIFTFFLLIFSVSCCMLFSDKRLSLCRLLASKGLRVWRLVLGEYISYALLMWLTVLLVSLAGEFLFVRIAPDYFEKGFLAALSVKLIPHVLMLSAMHFAIYELNGNIISGVLSQFVAAAAFGYISGCFYPYYFFPEAVQSFAAYLPSGICFAFLRGEFSGNSDFLLFPCLVYITAFLALSVFIRKRRLGRETA